MLLRDAKPGRWVIAEDNGTVDIPTGTRIQRTTNKLEVPQVVGVTEDGGVILYGYFPVSYESETFGDLSAGDTFTIDGDGNTFQKLSTNKYLYNRAEWPADGIAIDIDTLEPFNFDNDDEVEPE